jgi:hypothetical protein
MNLRAGHGVAMPAEPSAELALDDHRYGPFAEHMRLHIE